MGALDNHVLQEKNDGQHNERENQDRDSAGAALPDIADVGALFDLVAQLHLRLGEHAKARALFRRCAKGYGSAALSGNLLYNGARCSAQAGEETRAFEMLDQAVKAGLRDAARAENDPALASLRKDQRWKHLMERMKAER